jgi:hypothetical protein
MRIPRSPKQYELTNHLGNVLSTVLDRKTPITTAGGSGDKGSRFCEGDSSGYVFGGSGRNGFGGGTLITLW